MKTFWVIAGMALVYALAIDAGISFYFYEENHRIPFFIQAVFGNDLMLKLKVGSLFALVTAGNCVND